MSSSPTADDDAADVRRSGRKRKSTIVRIQGHSVLAKNNYVLKGGSYAMGAFEADDSSTKKARKPANKKPAANNGKPAPRQQKPSEVARLLHNDTVKASVLEKQVVRRDFLVQHKAILEPFMDEATRRTMEAWSNTKTTATAAYARKDLLAQPDLLDPNCEMRYYQLAGLNFMVDMHEQNLGMILGDEMGLGKTLQTIALFCYLKHRNEKTGPSLVVCPLSVLQSWCNELKKWAPSLKVLRLHASNPDEQANQRHEMAEHAADKYDVIVTTYDMVKVPQLMNMFNRLHFRYLVLDEGHKIKSGVTQIAQAVRKLHCENRLLLTGTPLQNNLTELISLLNFLHPDIFTNFKAFEDAFDITNNHIDKDKMVQSQKVLELFMLRRLKTQVEKFMPKKIETKVYCPLSSTQVFWYKMLLMKDSRLLAKVDNDQTEMVNTGSKNLLASMFMQLRKACIHPFLFDGAEPDISLTTLDDIVGASGKMAVLDALLLSLFKKGHRCVLFSQFTSMLDILADYCGMRGWNYCIFDGRTSRAKRNYYVNAFNAPDSPIFLFLMSTRSGSMGLNLQTADTCILFDSDQNPQTDLQAQARVHRIGQEKTVHVYRLVSSGTIEERIVQRAEKKLLLDQMVNREKADTGAQKNDESAFSGSEMLKDLKFGCAAVFGDSSQNALPTKKDIEYITDRNRSENDSNGMLKGGTSHKVGTYDLSQNLKETQVFGGVDFKALREEQQRESKEKVPTTLRGIARLQYDLSQIGSKRKVKNRIVMVDGKNSGYGMASVPVLASNNYELQNGESSVFDRELSSKSKDRYEVKKTKRAGPTFVNQEWCQHCGDGGLLHLCSRCPIAVHKKCDPAIEGRNGMASCTHHWCVVCAKPAAAAGGFLYPCQSCPAAYCEDCLPKNNKGFRILGTCDRLERNGFDSSKLTAYIHCSDQCEKYAMHVWGWKLPSSRKQVCPKELDVSKEFGNSKHTRKSPTRTSSAVGSSVLEVPAAASTTGASSSSESSAGEV